jgi:polyketide cyclase/dehydrase/lipid transport protein
MGEDTASMSRLEETRLLPVPRGEGFAYITDVGNWRSYWPKLLDIPDEDHVSWSTPGDTARVVLEVRGKPVEMRMDLAEFRPPELVTYDSTQEGLPTFHHERHFGERDGRLNYTLVIAFEPRRGVRGLVDRLFVALLVRRSLTETLDNLESIFRTRAA